MSVRQNAALHLAPLTLRVALGLIFLYYGAGKLFFADFELSLSQEATLVQLGVLKERPGGPVTTPVEAGDAMAPPAFEMILAQTGQEDAAMPVDEGAPAEQGDDGREAAEEPAIERTDGEVEPRHVSRVYRLVLTMNDAVQAGMWPDFLARGGVMKTLAWTVAIVEFVGGFFVLLGVFTRFWALSMVCVMAGAIYLTQIVPNWGATDAFLGFLPPFELADAGAWIGAYEKLFFQLIVGASAKALFFCGGGFFSVDRVIFGGGKKKTRELKSDDA